MGLPSGYTQYEYIESSGTQYIDTGFKPNQDTRVVADFELTSSYSSIRGIFGVRDTNSASAPKMFVFWNSGSSAFRSDYFGTNRPVSISPILDRYVVDKNKNVTTIGTESIRNSASSGQCTNDLFIFCVNAAGSANYFAPCRLWSCQVYDNGTLIRDYIPCSNPSGEVGLYDQVNGEFYGNAGTGTFSHGPIATPPAPQNLRQTGKTLETISLAWDVVETADGYKLYRDGVLIATQTATSYTDTGLLPSESYTYQVLAYNEQGDGSLSDAVSMSTEQAYYIITPVFESAYFSQNPTNINISILLSVSVSDEMIILQPEVFHSNEIYTGEA